MKAVSESDRSRTNSLLSECNMISDFSPDNITVGRNWLFALFGWMDG